MTYQNINDNAIWTEEEMLQYYIDCLNEGLYADVSYNEFKERMLENDFEEISINKIEG